MRRFGCFISIAIAAFHGAVAEVFPPVSGAKADAVHVPRLQRTLTMLHGSEPGRTNTVRVLLYGQPFDEANWFPALINHVQTLYPHARVVAENRSWARRYSNDLIRALESDVFEFRPDLILLSVYGGHWDTKALLQRIRERCSADVLLLGLPMRIPESLEEPTDRRAIAPDPKAFRMSPQNVDVYLNYIWYPDIADEFGAAFVDIRSAWTRYLKENRLPPKALMPELTRMSPQGDHVMTELLKPWFENPPWASSFDPYDNPRVSTYAIPQNLQWSGNRLKLEFTGVRVDLVLGGPVTGTLKILIDGLPPSERPEPRIAGRTSLIPGTRWPALLRVGRGAPLIDEEWTAEVTDIRTDSGQARFKFRVVGSKTGPDGEGTSEFEFLSKSKRVSILPTDWNFEFVRKQFGVSLPSQCEVKWGTILQGTDAFGPTSTVPPGESTVVLANGLEPKPHVIEVVASEPAPAFVRGLRIYRPARLPEPKRGGR